jgi:DNA-binding transcriptional MerR regulator
MERKSPLLTAAAAARILGVTPATVRLMFRRGDLKATEITESGMRLFAQEIVERLRDERDANRAETYSDEEARG